MGFAKLDLAFSLFVLVKQNNNNNNNNKTKHTLMCFFVEVLFYLFVYLFIYLFNFYFLGLSKFVCLLFVCLFSTIMLNIKTPTLYGENWIWC